MSNSTNIGKVLTKANKILFNNRVANTTELYQELDKELGIDPDDPVIQKLKSYAYDKEHSLGQYAAMEFYTQLVEEIYFCVREHYIRNQL